MSLLFGIRAEMQSAVADRPHIFSFATPRSVANDELVTVWNGATNAARKFAVDLNGRLHIGGLAAGDLIYGGAVLLTGTRRLESLVIGTANQVLRVNAGATAPEWASTLSGLTLTTPTINGAALSGTFSGTPTFSGAVTASGGVAISGGVTPLTVSSGAICVRLITPTTGQNPQIVWSPNSVDRWVIYAVDSDSTFRVRDAVTPVDVLTFVVGGAATFAAAVTTTGLLTASAKIASADDLYFTATDHGLRANTADASDNQRVLVCGGGAFADTRGAYLEVKGNEYAATGGDLNLVAGNVATGGIHLWTGGVERLTIAFGGGTTATGLLTASAGITLTGTLTMTTAISKLVPGATAFSVRDTADANTNLLVQNSGAVTVRNGLTVTAGTTDLGATILARGNLTFATQLNIVAGPTNLAIRDNANANNNLLITDAGVVTIRAGLTVTAGGATITAGDVAITAGNLTFAAAAARLIPGATSFSLRNNANGADNVLITDAGVVTIRAGLTVTAGNLTFGAAAARVIPGATSLTFRNNADSASNLVLADGGNVTFRGNTASDAFAATTLILTPIIDTSVVDLVLKRNAVTKVTIGTADVTFIDLLITKATAAGAAGLRLPHGTLPSVPVDGDMWTTTAGLFVRINGVTKTVTLT